MDEALGQQLEKAHEHRLAGAYGAAKVLYEEVLQQDSECPEACFWLGYTDMMGFGQFEKGLELMRRGVDLAPANAKFRLELAKAYLMLGEEGPGKEALIHIVKTWPGSREAEQAEKHLSYFSDVELDDAAPRPAAEGG